MRLTCWIVCLMPLSVTAARAQVDPDVLAAERARVEVVQRASATAVAIFAGSAGGGSGVVISSDGYALSNFHVTHEAGTAMKCGMADGRLYDAVIVGIDPTGDVALLKLLGREDFPFSEMADSDKVQVGDWCFAIGNPFLLATDFHPTVSYGVISGVHRYQYPAGSSMLLEYTDCLQSDAAINPGNSGGPMFDAQGRLIGINGRGSFEKRGRVNVGVGYAISMNQIKNFLGYLKSGRVVDHATLGARVASDENRRAVVDDILEESDAFRRGLRYGDEIVSFGGRPISTVNGLKNILGIFPRDWRVPLTYRRKGETSEIMVRLRGVHGEAELAELAAEGPKVEPEKVPQPKPEPGQPRPVPRPQAHPHAKKQPLPEIVQQHYTAKPGYVNYYFNQLNRDRVWKALVARGDYGALKSPWVLSGEAAGGEEFRLEVADAHASIKLPSGELRIELGDDLSGQLEPPTSGGLLISLALWRRFLVLGPEHFGDVRYWGTAPLEGYDHLLDVLVGTSGGVDCRFYCDPADGHLAALEMTPEGDTDPCELVFRDYRESDGHMVPGRIEVRHGDGMYNIFSCKQVAFETEPPKEGD
jgi:serine protease Do